MASAKPLAAEWVGFMVFIGFASEGIEHFLRFGEKKLKMKQRGMMGSCAKLSNLPRLPELTR
jgi:hypothetical protein